MTYAWSLQLTIGAAMLATAACAPGDSPTTPADDGLPTNVELGVAALDYRGRTAQLVVPPAILVGSSFGFVVISTGDRCRKPSATGNSHTTEFRGDTIIEESIFADSVITFRGGSAACGDTATFLRSGPTWTNIGTRFRFMRVVIHGVRVPGGAAMSLDRTIPIVDGMN